MKKVFMNVLGNVIGTAFLAIYAIGLIVELIYTFILAFFATLIDYAFGTNKCSEGMTKVREIVLSLMEVLVKD